MATWQPPQTAARPLRVGDLRAVRIAAAIAAMLLVGGLVLRGSLGLTREQPERFVRTDPDTGLITTDGAGLANDADGPLFDGVDLAPGETVDACVRIDYRGDVDPDAVALQLAGLEGSETLARRLHVVIERGELATDTGCAGFQPDQLVADAPLLGLARSTTEPGGALPSWDPGQGEAHAWYRVAVTLDPGSGDDLQGTRAGTGFVWSALGPAQAASWLRGVLLLLASVARDTVIPVLVLVAVTVLFLGIQDRIDRRDPKLALAPLTNEPLSFTAAPDGTAPTPADPTVEPLVPTGGAPWHA